MELWPSKYNYFFKLDNKYTLINNLLTGAIDFIDSRTWDSVLGGKFGEVGSSPLSDLIERGYFYKDPDEEEKLFNKLYKNFLKKAVDRPIKYVICPTFTCNLKCTYCFEKQLPGNPHKNMDSEMLSAAFNSIKAVSRVMGLSLKNMILENLLMLLNEVSQLLNNPRLLENLS